MTDIIQQLLDLKEWSQDSARYERRMNFRAGQLVQPGPGRQGYNGDSKSTYQRSTQYKKRQEALEMDKVWDETTKRFRKSKMKEGIQMSVKEATEINKNLPPGIQLKKEGPNYYYRLQSAYKPEGKKQILEEAKLRATDENLRILKKKQIAFNKKYYPNRLSDIEFERLRMLEENINLSDPQFAKKLNDKGWTTYRGKTWKKSHIHNKQKDLGLSEFIYPEGISGRHRTINEAKEIIRQAPDGKQLIADLYKIEDKGLRDSAIKYKATRLTADQARLKKTGLFRFKRNTEQKLWTSFWQSAQRGDRMRIGGTFNGQDLAQRKNWPRKDGDVNWHAKDKKTGKSAWEMIEFTDTQVPDKTRAGKFKEVTFTWDADGKGKGNLQSQVDDVFTKGFFARSTSPYGAQRTSYAKNLGKELSRQMIIDNYQAKNKGAMPSEKFIQDRMSIYAPEQVHHVEGVGKNPYRVESAFKLANEEVNYAEMRYKKKLADAGTDKAKIKAAKDEFRTSVQQISDRYGGIRFDVDGKIVGTKATSQTIRESAAHASGFASFSDFKKGMYQEAQSNGIGNTCGVKVKKAEGGRIGFASGTQSFDDCMRSAIADETRVAKGFGAKAAKAGQRLLGVAKWAGKWIGLIDVPIEFAFALPALLRGDIEGAKRHTTFGLLGWGETQMEQMKETNPEAYKFLKHDNDVMNWQQAEWQLGYLNEAKERLEKMNVSGYGSNELNKINTQIEELLANQTNIEENYLGYEYTDEVALGKQMLGSYVKNEADRHREARDRGEVLGMQKPIVDEAFGELTPTSIRPEKEREAVEYPDTYGGYLMKKQFDKTEGRYREDPIIEALIEEGPYMEVDEWRKRYMPEKSAISPAQLNAMYGSGAIQDYYNTVQSAQGSPGFNYAGFAGGGIAGIRRPWAVPPESGPMPQGGGLSSQFNRVKKLTG